MWRFRRKKHSSPVNEFIQQYGLNAQRHYERVGSYFAGRVRNLLSNYNIHEDMYRFRKLLKKNKKNPQGTETNKSEIKNKRVGAGAPNKISKAKTWDGVLGQHTRWARKFDVDRSKNPPVVGPFLREYAR